jgi:hypothetical protein
VTVQTYRHLSDLRTRLLLRARSAVASDEIVSKAESCAGALDEASRVVAGTGEGARLGELLDHAGALLDELDEHVLALAHDDRAVFAQLELLRGTLNVLAHQRSQFA